MSEPKGFFDEMFEIVDNYFDPFGVERRLYGGNPLDFNASTIFDSNTSTEGDDLNASSSDSSFWPFF